MNDGGFTANATSAVLFACRSGFAHLLAIRNLREDGMNGYAWRIGFTDPSLVLTPTNGIRKYAHRPLVAGIAPCRRASLARSSPGPCFPRPISSGADVNRRKQLHSYSFPRLSLNLMGHRAISPHEQQLSS
jgi:hypothetical protein